MERYLEKNNLYLTSFSIVVLLNLYYLDYKLMDKLNDYHRLIDVEYQLNLMYVNVLDLYFYQEMIIMIDDY